MSKQITNFEGLKKYYCRVCEGYHRKSMSRKGKRIMLKPFKNHKEFAILLTKAEIFNRQFVKSVRKYSIKSHKKSKGSSKQ